MTSYHTTYPYHVWVPQWLTHAVQLLCAGPTHHKVLGLHGAANQIHGGDVRLIGLGVEAGHDGLHKIRTKPGSGRGSLERIKAATVDVMKTAIPIKLNNLTDMLTISKYSSIFNGTCYAGITEITAGFLV